MENKGNIIMNLFNKITRSYIPSMLDNIYKSQYQDEVDNVLRKHFALYQHHAEFDAKDLACEIQDEGYVVIPSVFSDELLEKVRSEFHKIIKHADNLPYRVDRDNGATCVRVENNSKFELRNYVISSAFFNSPVLEDIAKAFYNLRSSEIDLNTEIFVHETPETDEPLSGTLHWDRAQTLKFWIYIDDLPPEAGPMRIEKGSISRNRNERVHKHDSKKQLVGGVDNIIKENEDNIVVLSAPEGSVMIFDTDASHGATQVQPGYVRRIMRGHTRLKK